MAILNPSAPSRPKSSKSVVCGLARCTPKDVERAGEGDQACGQGGASTSSAPRQQNPSRAQAEERARRRSSASASNRSSRPGNTRTTSSSPRRTPAGPSWIFWKRSPRPRSKPARRRSTCPTPSATPRPKATAKSSAHLIEEAADHPTSAASSSRPIVTTTWAWPSPIHWRPLKTAPGRSNARSTASASAPATRRWKKSSWRCKTRHDFYKVEHAHRRHQDLPRQPDGQHADRADRAAQQGDRRRERVRPRSRHPPGRHPEIPRNLRDHGPGRRRASPKTALVLGKHSRPARVQGSRDATGLYA